MAKKKTKVIATRVNVRFADLLEQYCRRDAYINCADFFRGTLREKLRKDAPDLFKQLFDGENATVDSNVKNVVRRNTSPKASSFERS